MNTRAIVTIIFDNIKILKPSLCQQIVGKFKNQLLIRPLDVYEIPKTKSVKKLFGQNVELSTLLDLKNSTEYLYKSNQKIKSVQNLNLIGNILDFNIRNSSENKIEIRISEGKKQKSINFIIDENLCLPNYLPARLRYTDINVCLLSESNQFIDRYSKLGYFENISHQSLEIVKLKSKYKENKQLLLISNNDCLTIKKELIPNKSVNDLVIKNINVNQIGKVIIDNGKVLTIQKGRPYFFPNCQADESQKIKNSKYKL